MQRFCQLEKLVFVPSSAEVGAKREAAAKGEIDFDGLDGFAKNAGFSGFAAQKTRRRRGKRRFDERKRGNFLKNKGFPPKVGLLFARVCSLY